MIRRATIAYPSLYEVMAFDTKTYDYVTAHILAYSIDHANRVAASMFGSYDLMVELATFKRGRALELNIRLEDPTG